MSVAMLGVSSPSPGCSPVSPVPAPGTAFDIEEEFAGVSYTHRVSIPADYVPNRIPTAMFLYFHGWGGDSTSCGQFCEKEAPAAGFLTVAMTVHKLTEECDCSRTLLHKLFYFL